MIYQMNLHQGPFDLIKSGKKTIEMRLNTLERANIGIGDTIEFTSRISGEKLSVLVINIKKYPTFKELYEDNDLTKLGYQKGEKASPDDMLTYYKAEDIQKYGVLAIFIKLI